MKLLLAALAVAMLLTVAIPTHGASLPFEAVRVLSVGEMKYCSAVVIEPEVALTAGHCLQRHMKVDGKKVDVIVAPADGKDIAVLQVPGLQCPCVSRGVRPAEGDQVLAVGYPVDREGNRNISPVARVKAVGRIADIVPNLPETPDSNETYIVTDAAIIDHGDSGGGLFAMQDGEWRVIGINAIGIPEGPCKPFVGCGKEIGSGFVPVDLAEKLL